MMGTGLAVPGSTASQAAAPAPAGSAAPTREGVPLPVHSKDVVLLIRGQLGLDLALLVRWPCARSGAARGEASSRQRCW